MSKRGISYTRVYGTIVFIVVQLLEIIL